MAFFLNNNTTSMFKAAKQLTNLSKDFTIFMKKMEQAKTLDSIMESYEKAIEVCGQMEEVSQKAMLSAGISAAEERIEEIIATTVSALVRLIQNADSRDEMLQEVLSCGEIFAEEILDGVKEATR